MTLTKLPLLSFPSTTAEINSISIDPIHQILYFTTNTNTIDGATEGVYKYTLATNPITSSGIITPVFTETTLAQDVSHPFGNPADIVVDPISGKYYLSEIQFSRPRTKAAFLSAA